MPGKKIPVERGERAGLGARGFLGIVAAALAGIAHPVEIGTRRAVGLGCHHAAVGKLTHAERVGQLHPLDSVDVDSEVPLVHLPGLHAEEEREQAGHHQPLDVMGIAMLERLADGVPEAVHVGVAGPVESGQRSVGPEGVAVDILRHELPVDAADVLPPADHLPDETLRGLERRLPFSPGPLGAGDDVTGVEQLHVERLRDPRVVEPGLTGPDGVLVAAKRGEAVGEKVVQRRAGFEGRHRPVELGKAAWMAGEPRVHQVDDAAGDRVGGEASRRRQHARPLLRKCAAVLGVEVPLAPSGLAVVHEHAKLLP